MVKNKFIKNLYQIISFIGCELVITSPILAIYFWAISTQNYHHWLLGLIVLLNLLYLLIGYYWIFQTIEINETGIKVKLFRKTLRFVYWEDIDGITYKNAMRNPAFSIVVKNGKNLNLDSRKKIKFALNFYGNCKITKALEDLHPANSRNNL